MEATANRSMSFLIEQLDAVFQRRRGLIPTLADSTVVVGNYFSADVCSIYRWDSAENLLVLAATVGLRQDSIGRIRMRRGEGLVGVVAQTGKPLAVREAQSHPRFKYFPDAGEEFYQSFLGVPIVRNREVFGVLVVQSIEPREFSAHEERSAITVARLIGTQMTDGFCPESPGKKPAAVTLDVLGAPVTIDEQTLSSIRIQPDTIDTRKAAANQLFDFLILARGKRLSEIDLDDAKTVLIQSYQIVNELLPDHALS